MFGWCSQAVFMCGESDGTGGCYTQMKAAKFRRPFDRITSRSIRVRYRILAGTINPFKCTGHPVIVLSCPPPMFSICLSPWVRWVRFRCHSLTTANSLALPRTLTCYRGGALVEGGEAVLEPTANDDDDDEDGDEGGDDDDDDDGSDYDDDGDGGDDDGDNGGYDDDHDGCEDDDEDEDADDNDDHDDEADGDEGGDDDDDDDGSDDGDDGDGGDDGDHDGG